MEESEEMHPAPDSSDNDETADDQRIHLFLDSSDSESVQDDEDISCNMDVTEEEESLAKEQSEAYPHIQDGEGHRSDQSRSYQPLSASPQTGEKKLLNAISGLSLTQFVADVNEQFTLVNSRLLSIEDRLAALKSKNCVEDTNSKKRRLVHNPKIAVVCNHVVLVTREIPVEGKQ
ncbi:uro-adherence factor A-like [Chanodichthys erythropterus]|uniref:uro-adherence factor A-like n=1 Tax=Chanodichthys erythropterus TaxID=933992 RepID=UPI00351EC84B